MSAKPKAVDGLEITEVGDGLVVYDSRDDRVHFLNGTASVVFLLCNGRRDRTAVIDAVAKVFGPEALFQADVEACLDQLHAEGVVR